MAVCAALFATLTTEPGGNRYERAMHSLGPTGRDVLAALVLCLAIYLLVVAVVPGPAARVAPEGIWVAGLAREGIAKATLFVTAEDVVVIEVREKTWGRHNRGAPQVVIRCRSQLPIEVNCYSLAEGEEFAAKAIEVLEPVAEEQ